MPNMINIGDLVKVKTTNIYGIVVGSADLFDVCQETENMLVVSINNSEETKMFKQDSIEKVDKVLH